MSLLAHGGTLRATSRDGEGTTFTIDIPVVSQAEAAEQADSMEESSSSMEEMAANIRQNADNALQTEHIALKAAEDARESGEAVTGAVEAMQEIAKKVFEDKMKASIELWAEKLKEYYPVKIYRTDLQR